MATAYPMTGHPPSRGAGRQAGIARIAPEPPGDWPVPRPAPDAAPDWVAAGTPPELAGALSAALGDGGLAGRASDLIRYASDASCYRSIPRAVAVPRDIGEVAAVMAVARRTGTPLVFRAGGTSLNGQSQTDGILAGLPPALQSGDGRGGRRRGARPAGRRARARQPAARAARAPCRPRSGQHRDRVPRRRARQQLRRDALRRARRLLPHAALADLRARRRHRDRHRRAGRGRAVRGLRARARRRARARSATSCARDRELAGRVARKFEIKNTTGYRLCAFLDYDEPLEIFAHLLIGSEGTLAFIGEAVMDTVPLGRHTTLSLSLLRGHRHRGRRGAGARRERRERDRADGRPDADRRRLEHARDARALEGAAAHLGRAAGRVPRRGGGRAGRAGARRRRDPRGAQPDRSGRGSAGIASRSRCSGTCARACRACSPPCAAPA